MSEDTQFWAILVAGFLVLAGGIMGTCSYQAKLDASAPVVETCIKHPATRSPVGSMQR